MEPRFARGYTLVEMLVVIGIASVTLLAATVAILLFYRANAATLAQAYAVAGARQGLAQSVAAIRGIQYGADGSYPLDTVNPYSFTFYSDLNGDGVAEKVTFALSGANFTESISRSGGNPPAYGAPDVQTLSGSVQNGAEGVPIFHYYNAAGAELFSISTANSAAYVTVDLIVNQAPASQHDYSLRSAAALRNVGQFQ